MKNTTILFCSLVLASSAVLAQQSLLNAGQAATPAPSLTDQVENAAEQKLLQAAPAPVQQGVQKLQQAQQLQNAVGAVSGAPASGTAINSVGGAAETSGAAATNAGSTQDSSAVAPSTPKATSGKAAKEHFKYKGAHKLTPAASATNLNPSTPTPSTSTPNTVSAGAGATTSSGSTSIPAGAAVTSPSGSVVDVVEGAVKQKAADGAINLLK